MFQMGLSILAVSSEPSCELFIIRTKEEKAKDRGYIVHKTRGPLVIELMRSFYKNGFFFLLTI